MAAALGMILGAGTRMLSEHAQQQRQLEFHQKEAYNQMLEDHFNRNPEDAASPSFAKEGKKAFGETWDARQQIYGMAAMHKQKDAASFPGNEQGQSQGQPQGQPQSLDDQLAAKRKHIADLQQWGLTHPEHADQVKSFVEQTNKDIESIQKQGDYEATRADRLQTHKDTEADREATRVGQAETRSLMMGMKASQDQFERDYKTQQQGLEKERDQATKDSKVETLKRTLDTGADKITADFAAAAGKQNSDDIKSAFKARADSYNTSAAQFYRKHADAGAPTLLKFKEGVKSTGLGGTMGLGTAGVSPTLEAVPPQYGNYKGKSGWLDADGNFYPDAGTN